MNRYVILAALLLNISACDAETRPTTQAPPRHAANIQCTSAPCGNTASGKDPQQERIEAGQQLEHGLRASGDDRKRWSIPIFSTSERPEDLALEVVRSAKLTVQLSPAQGHLTISTPATKHVFAIALPQGAGGVCPTYNLHVVEASDVHILVKRVCRKFEYKPGQYARSVTYYLYDQPTGTMRDIWKASASGANDPLPDARPRPALKRVPNGYQFDWSGTDSADAGAPRQEIHNRYIRKLHGPERTLVCTDMSAKPGSSDGSMCESEFVARVGS